MKTFYFSTYISPFTWRYGSEEMRHIFSEEHKYKIWRKIWVALATAEHSAGLLTDEELADLKKNENNVDIERILEIEYETKHDVVAAIREFAEKAPIGGGKIHLGATSMDIVDNADMTRVFEAFTIIEKKLKSILTIFSPLIETHASTTCIGFTHIQPAEPTTVGYRLSLYAQDLLNDYQLLQVIKPLIKSKGMRGAVGTAASYAEILHGTTLTPDGLNDMVMKQLGIDPVLITGQVTPRKFDYFVMMTLSSIAQSLSKFAGDLRILQSPPIGEWSEPFGDKQVGSSAMPFKKNPLNSEKICSLGRLVMSFPQIAAQNAALSYLERTLDDSANKRIYMTEGFLAIDEMLNTAEKIIAGLVINTEKISFNLAQYGPFAATESVIIATVKKGADRQRMHEVLRKISLEAWSQLQMGQENPMKKLLLENTEIKKYMPSNLLEQLFDVSRHTGISSTKAVELTKIIASLTHEK